MFWLACLVSICTLAHKSILNDTSFKNVYAKQAIKINEKMCKGAYIKQAVKRQA